MAWKRYVYTCSCSLCILMHYNSKGMIFSMGKNHEFIACYSVLFCSHFLQSNVEMRLPIIFDRIKHRDFSVWTIPPTFFFLHWVGTCCNHFRFCISLLLFDIITEFFTPQFSFSSSKIQNIISENYSQHKSRKKKNRSKTKLFDWLWNLLSTSSSPKFILQLWIFIILYLWKVEAFPSDPFEWIVNKKRKKKIKKHWTVWGSDDVIFLT